MMNRWLLLLAGTVAIALVVHVLAGRRAERSSGPVFKPSPLAPVYLAGEDTRSVRAPLRPDAPPSPADVPPHGAILEAAPDSIAQVLAAYHGVPTADIHRMLEATQATVDETSTVLGEWGDGMGFAERAFSLFAGDSIEARDYSFESKLLYQLPGGGADTLEQWAEQRLGPEADELDQLVAVSDARDALQRVGAREVHEWLMEEYREAIFHVVLHDQIDRAPFVLLQAFRRPPPTGNLYLQMNVNWNGWATVVALHAGHFPGLDAAMQAWQEARRLAQQALIAAVPPR